MDCEEHNLKWLWRKNLISNESAFRFKQEYGILSKEEYGILSKEEYGILSKDYAQNFTQ